MTTTAAKLDLELYSNESLNETIIYKSNGTPVDLTGAQVFCQIKDGGPTGTLVQTLNTLNGGITLADQGTDPGQFTIALSQTLVDSITDDLYLTYDVVVVQAAVRKRIIYGSIVVRPGITEVVL
jgi:hypothetical protein